MNSTQIHQMITTLGIDQEILIQAVQEHYHNDYPVDSQEFKQSFVELLEKMDLNLYQKLQMYSPMVNTHRDITYSTETVQLHSHQFYEILFCETGNLQYLIGEKRYSIHRGDIILVPPGTSHRPIFHEALKEPYSRIVLWVSSEFIHQLSSQLPNFQASKEHYLIRTADTPYQSISSLFLKGIEESLQRNLGWQSSLYYSTGMLLTEIYRIINSDSILEVKEKESELDKIISYIENNYTKEISLDKTAHAFLISKSTLSKLFQSHLGISFYRFVTQRRLIHAKQQIKKGEALEKIGFTCGFNDYATFYRAFKKEYGLSPKEYQKLCI